MMRLTPLFVCFFLLGTFLSPALWARPLSCDAPVGLQATVTGNTALLQWDAVAGATGYWVEVENEDNTPFFNIEVQVGANQYTVTGLAIPGSYKFKVRTKCGGDQSNWSDWTFFNTSGGGGSGGTGGGSCAIPDGHTVSNNSSGSATLTWNAVAGATAYWVEVESENLTPPFQVEVLVNTNTYVVSGLIANASYKFKVRSVCSGGQSDWSDWYFFSGSGSGGGTGGGSCTAPTSISISNPTGTSAAISWGAVVNATGYWIEVESENVNPVFHLEVPVGANTYQVNGLVPNRKYKVKLRSVCGGSQSDWSGPITFNSSTGAMTASGNSGGGAPNCGKPAGLSTSGLTTTGAVLSWKPVPGAISYAVRVEDGPDNNNTFLFSASTADTFYVLTGLLAGKNYKFKVRTRCADDHSKWSKWFHFSTPPNFQGGDNEGMLSENRQAVANTVTDVQLYPNPVTDRFTVRVSGADPAQPVQFRVLDLKGQVLLDQQVRIESETFEQAFDTASMPNGWYLLQWRHQGQVQTRKFLVQKGE
jgi:hypothetical protein